MIAGCVVQEGQSLLDIALLLYGAADGALDLASGNGIAVSDKPTAGTVLSYDTAKVRVPDVVSNYRTEGLIPVSY